MYEPVIVYFAFIFFFVFRTIGFSSDFSHIGGFSYSARTYSMVSCLDIIELLNWRRKYIICHSKKCKSFINAFCFYWDESYFSECDNENIYIGIHANIFVELR